MKKKMTNIKYVKFPVHRTSLNEAYCSKIEKIKNTTKDFSCDTCNNTIYSCQMKNLKEIKPLIDISAFHSVCRNISGLAHKLRIKESIECGKILSEKCYEQLLNEVCFCKIIPNNKSYVKNTLICICFNKDHENNEEVSLCKPCKMVRRVCTMDIDENKKQFPFSSYGSNPVICLVHSYPFYIEHFLNCKQNKIQMKIEEPAGIRNIQIKENFFEKPEKEETKKKSLEINESITKKNIYKSTSKKIMKIKKLLKYVKNEKNHESKNMSYVQRPLNPIQFSGINRNITYKIKNGPFLISDFTDSFPVKILLTFTLDLFIHTYFFLLFFMTILYVYKGIYFGTPKRKMKKKENLEYSRF